MPKYKFTQEQFDRISLLLKRRLEESRDEQKKTRAEIRRSGFYISHHFKGFTNDNLKELLQRKEIEIVK